MVDTTSQAADPVAAHPPDPRAGTDPTPAQFADDIAPRRPGPAPALSPWETVRWAWRQLTSMRTALILLFLLALAAVPGSLVPQRNQNPAMTAMFVSQHRNLAPWYERLHLFAVYSSPWFAAVYLLLFTSLVGCIVPRLRVHARGLRSKPTLTPRVLSRMPAHTSWTTAAAPEQVLAVAADHLRTRHGLRSGHRLAARPDHLSPVAAERGHLRESGNLLFHVALLVVLGGVAAGSLFGYRATAIVAEGSGFSNQYADYGDNLTLGALRRATDLPPFSVQLNHFQATFMVNGSPEQFLGQFTVTDSLDSTPREETLRLNHPLSVPGASISLLGNGYAPTITVRDRAGAVVYSDDAVFLPFDNQYSSEGAVKIPDMSPTGLEIAGLFLPTGVTGAQGSVFPGPGAPQLRLIAYRGAFTLGAGSGSIYTPDTNLFTSGKLKPYTTATGQPLTFTLRPAETFAFPDGSGTVTFDGFHRWANVQVDVDPGAPFVLGGSVAAVVGLCGSLFLRRRRWWVRAGTDGAGNTVVEVAGLDRNDSTDLSEELAYLVDVLHRAAPPEPEPPEPAPPVRGSTEGTPA